jgi:hypothetical protein
MRRASNIPHPRRKQMNDECDPAELLTRRGLLKAINAALLALGTAEAVPAFTGNALSSPTGTNKVREIENTWIPTVLIEAKITTGWERGNLRPRLLASSTFTTTKTEFVIVGELTALNGEEKVLIRTWNQKIPRQLV